MTLIELGFFTLQVWAGVASAKKFASDTVSSRIQFYLLGHFSALVSLILLGKILDVRRWFLSEFPLCEKGRCCKRRDYVRQESSIPGVSLYRCRCGDAYARIDDEVYRFDETGVRIPFARPNQHLFFIQWERVDSRQTEGEGEK